MKNFLLKHALENVWCNPDQDHQAIISGARISKAVGVFNRFEFMSRSMPLPTRNTRYHVYQIGQLHPRVVKMLPPFQDWQREAWVQVSDVVNRRKTFVDLYIDRGVQIPKYKSFYTYTSERCLLVAIEDDANIDVDYAKERLYMRLYKNAYFETMQADQGVNFLKTNGITVANLPQLLAFQSEYESVKTMAGHTYAYCNGYYVPAIGILHQAIGDRVEYVYDSSVKRIVTFDASKLMSFDSELDNRRKFILHHVSMDNTTIDYFDDIDIHVYYEIEPGKFKGVYYHRNMHDAIRMLTHRDYAIPVDYVVRLIRAIGDNLGIRETIEYNKIRIELKVRRSGTNRALIYDNNRLFELYKMSSEQVMQAFTGVNSLVPEWNAVNLEKCGYTQLMRCLYEEIDVPLMQRAYGYNGMSKVTGDTPQKTYLSSGQQTVDLPYLLQTNSTAYEYDSSGNLLSWHYHPVGSEYRCKNDNAHLVEVISGKGSHRPNVIFGKDNLELPMYDNYRVYMCYAIGGIPDNNWKDITDSELYRIENNRLVWNNLELDQFLMIRCDDSFIAYDIELEQVAGTYYFTLSEYENRFGVHEHYVLGVPLGDMDIFVNGKSLIKGLGYTVKFPKVYILDQSCLIQPIGSEKQKVHVRLTGFCDKTLSMEPVDDFGFVEQGLISENERFDVRDDRVMRIVIGHQTVSRDDYRFSELISGINPTHPLNGQPYLIKDIVVPLKELVNENTYSLRKKSQDIDQRVSDYLTIKLPEPTRNAPNAIPSYYKIVSPFVCHLIHDLNNGELKDFIDNKRLSDQDVVEICRRYESVLAFDPIYNNVDIDWRYVSVLPHSSDTVIDLSLYQYRFLVRAIALIIGDKVQLSDYVSFSAV